MLLRRGSFICHATAMLCAKYSRGSRGDGARTEGGAWRAVVLVFVLGMLCAALVASAHAADSPGAALRQYLDARWRGDVAAAQALWDPDDIRRSEALGTRYPGLEARFDDNLLWSAADRAAAQARRPAVRDSSVESAWARYTVVLPGPAGADSLRYFVRKLADGWHVTAPFAKLTVGWTARDTRFMRVRATRLRNINADALATLDAGVLSACERLGVPEVARLRLERIKIEYYLCDSDESMRLLGVAPSSDPYRLAGERIVTQRVADLQSTCRALVHLAFKDAPPVVVPFLDRGLPTALGGAGDANAGVWLQRGAALAAAPASDPTAVFDASATHGLKPEDALALSAAWSDALLRELGAERFAALYRKLSGSPSEVAALDGAAVRREVEAATVKRGPALLEWLRKTSSAVTPPLAAGCTTIPRETQQVQPILRWRDAQERWALEGYDQGDSYIFSIGPYQGPVPPWAQRMADSLATAHGVKPDTTGRRPHTRPPGDPPRLVILLRERLVLQPDAYESPLFQQQFTKRRYAGDLYGLFIDPDQARLYDYRRDMLVGASSPAVATPGVTPYYDEKAGRLCFRLSHDSFLKDLGEYMVVVLLYTGE
jgi:hypothetical protein